jgi:hypothetical protein
MVDSNDKGRRGEIQVRDLIRPWWGILEPGADFTRTPKSGGWHASGEYDMAGDLMTKARLFPFCVEVKFRERWTMENVLAGKNSPVWAWWRQACKDAEKSDPKRVPMLWFRQRSSEWSVLVPRKFIDDLGPMALNADCEIFPNIAWRHLPVRPVLYSAKRFLRHDPSVFARAL